MAEASSPMGTGGREFLAEGTRNERTIGLSVACSICRKVAPLTRPSSVMGRWEETKQKR